MQNCFFCFGHECLFLVKHSFAFLPHFFTQTNTTNKQQPSRLEAQRDAANFVAQGKLEANPESAVAVMTSGGRYDNQYINLRY